MAIKTENYNTIINRLPKEGQWITAHEAGNDIIVYQAYKPSIAAFAVQHQLLGGSDFSYNRMSWIKPNFLWMMFRCGWASKENQECVLAIWIDKVSFEEILTQAVFSSFNEKHYTSHDDWKNELTIKNVRLQWDPEHDPYGNKIERKAIQLGMKGDVLEKFGKQQIKKIEDITGFVKEQKQIIDNGQLDKLLVPGESVYRFINENIAPMIGAQNQKT